MSDALPQLLVLDGDGALHGALARALPHRGVLRARDAAEARAHLERHPGLELLVTRLSPEAAEAWSACKELRPRLRVVLVAADAALVAFAERMRLGELRVLDAPDDPARVRATVEPLLAEDPPAAAEAGPTGPLAVADAPGPWSREPGADSRLRLREDWVNVVAHDIRTPLSIINTYAALLLGSEGNLNRADRAMVQRIRYTGTWLMHLVDSMLELAMVKEGPLTLKCAPVRLGTILETVLENMRGLAELQGVELRLEAPVDTALHRLDHIKVEQVLQNLLANGIKFSRPGDHVVLFCRAEPGHVTFRVSDAGEGMRPEQAARAFDKYASLAGPEHPGYGLGLAIAKALVELHGGRIWVESQPGRGTTFHFTVVPEPPAQ